MKTRKIKWIFLALALVSIAVGAIWMKASDSTTNPGLAIIVFGGTIFGFIFWKINDKDRADAAIAAGRPTPAEIRRERRQLRKEKKRANSAKMDARGEKLWGLTHGKDVSGNKARTLDD